MELVMFGFGAIAGALAVYAFRTGGDASRKVAEPSAAPAPASDAGLAGDGSGDAATGPGAYARAVAMGKALDEVYQQAERGQDLEREAGFQQLVAFLASEAFDPAQRLSWITSQNMPLSCAAIAAMTAAGDDAREDVARLLGRLGYFPFHFALKHLRVSNDPWLCGLVLLRVRDWTAEYPATREALSAYLDQIQAAGEVPRVSDAAAALDWYLEERREVLGQHAHPLIEGFLATLEQLQRRRRGQQELARVGRAIPTRAADAVFAYSPSIRARVDALHSALLRPGRPSIVLVGDEGAGKSALARSVLHSLMDSNWQVVEATPSQLLAGQSYVGQLEQRIEELVAGLDAERGILFVPDWAQLLEQGKAGDNAVSLLDRLLPYVERGQLQMLGECGTDAFARAAARVPRLQGLFTALKVESLPDDETLELARDWVERVALRAGVERADVADDAVLAEACELARQQYPERAEPGRTLQLLSDAVAAATATTPPALPILREDLLGALSRRSGLPMELLDGRQRLDMAAVRDFFARRVIGQDEAVDCLVDRIGMLKAGLTDPRRPIGVFLFAGPTGTGKTELAKALADYLFGSPDRMLRVDMSEYQSDDAAWRLLGDAQREGDDALTTRVRQNPFAVVLLDEFEKAHPRVWDLFLQVFDDGRLSDRNGRTADFRHCIIVLTSNLGATIDKGGGPGFVSTRGSFSREAVGRTIDATFRREFINRLDRVVVFRPLSRALMREILQKELRAVLNRRGFRGRDWAVEWEPSAIEFLLERGFTPDLGARPLRRAIDQYLLAPLSRTIVEHRVPSGEQFLFVQAGGDGLDVRFVDPDAAPEPAAGAASAAGAATTPADLRALALDPRAGGGAHEVLSRAIASCRAQVDDAPWLALKASQAREMEQPNFWQHADRQAVLDRLERVDRIESGLRAAEALEARLLRGGGRGAPDLVRRLALLVMALERGIAALRADEPEDAMLELRPADPRAPGAMAWRDALAAMYRHWGEARGVRMQAQPADAVSGTLRIEASGLGAWQALREEAGLHVLESRVGDAEQRSTVRVKVAPVPAFAAAGIAGESEARLCRRYDDGAAPLVRDLQRGWRSGRLDRVLAGDFDLMDADRG